MVSGGLAVEPDARRTNDWALALVGLPELMARTAGALTVPIGFLDGPVAIDHPDLAGADIRAVNGRVGAACISPFTARATTALTWPGSCLRDAAPERRPSAPAHAARASYLLRGERDAGPRSPAEVAHAIAESVTAGARVVNLSAATPTPTMRAAPAHGGRWTSPRARCPRRSRRRQPGRTRQLGHTRHPWVIPVVGYDAQGSPLDASTSVAPSAGNGLGAPGEAIESLDRTAGRDVGGGSSAAAAFVTGASRCCGRWSPIERPPRAKRAVARPCAAGGHAAAADAEAALRSSHTDRGG